MRFALLLTLLGVVLPTLTRAADPVDYVRDIKPILSNSCYTCHGPDEATREAELRLDLRDVATSNVIVPLATVPF